MPRKLEYWAAERIMGWVEDRNKPTTIYYFGDHDPSGVDISRVLESKIRKPIYARDAMTFAELNDDDEIFEETQQAFAFERVAVLPWQIDAWSLPTRPTKKSDSRAKNFQGASVELETITPSQLRDMVDECIEQHVDQRKLAMTQRIEKLERRTLQSMVDGLQNGEDGDLPFSGGESEVLAAPIPRRCFRLESGRPTQIEAKLARFISKRAFLASYRGWSAVF